jgi:hypothetical protein
MAARAPLRVVLLTDFGPDSPYVGEMKLALAQLAPNARVLDLAHDLPPHQVGAAAVVLTGARRFLPVPCVVCAVVDPGVGSARRIVAARYPGPVWVLAPDNGLLKGLRGFGKPVVLRAIANRRLWLSEVSAVFHGRDIFAPVAAALCAGTSARRLGPALQWDELAPAPWGAPRLERRPSGVRVLYVDRFGNLVTNLWQDDLVGGEPAWARCKGRTFPFAECYSDVGRGRAVALWGSFGFLELALREGSAAQALGARVGTRVQVGLGRPSCSRSRVPGGLSGQRGQGR